ncbi:MAG: adenylate/guanylate cyclase domain-containing protein [Cellvibrionaceae bacterium]
MSDIENLTIMFTDIVGFSKMVSSLSRKESQGILQQHDRILQKIIKRFGGRIIKSVGDSFLVVFRSPTDSVLCAMAMQDKLWEYNKVQEESHKIVIRVALNAGEVRLTSNDVFGDAVNIAARLESKTPAGAILLTESVYLSMNKNEVSLKALGKHQFKGMPQAIAIYQAKHKKHQHENPAFSEYPYGGAHKTIKPVGRSGFQVGKMFVGLCAAVIAAFVTWFTTITYMPGPSSVALDKIEVEYTDAITQAKKTLPTIEEAEASKDTVVVSVPSPESESTTSITEKDEIEFPLDITAVIRDKAVPLLKSKKYNGVRELVDEYQADYPDNAYLKMLLGHADIHFKNHEASLNHYTKALEIDPILANDKLLSTNLVKLLEYERLKANRLIGRYMSEPMINALSKRSGKSGLRGRYDAFYLLKDSGNVNKIDKVGLNIWDLRELKECSLKKVAIQELKRLDDPRALPALQEVANMGLWKIIKYNCLRQEVNETIKQLEEKKETQKAEAILNQDNSQK